MALIFYYDRGAAPSDTTPPSVSITAGPTRTKLSRVVGFDATDLTFRVNEAYQAYEVKAVPSGSSLRTSGSLIESGTGGAADTDRTITITDDELVAAGLIDGSHVLKVFAQDTAGNWSTDASGGAAVYPSSTLYPSATLYPSS